MGTYYIAKVGTRRAPKGLRQDAVAQAMRGCLGEVNERMSTYLPSSELSRFNDNPSTEPVKASAPLRLVVTEAQRVSALSGGAFDVTIGPLVDAWGFGPLDRPASPPSPQVIEGLRGALGYQQLRVGEGTLQKAHPHLRVDLSGIAKGYAVDVCAERLEGLGAVDYMIEVGGEVRAKGRNPRGEPWRIGVERPSPTPEQPIQRVIALKDAALATSGDYRNYYELEGQRLSHTIDPRTGAPIAHRLASVSVISPTCMTADALATALNVLGPQDGVALAQQLQLSALFLIRTDQGFEEVATGDFLTYSPSDRP
jgi:thiamine biosynthesis lipoprotein